MAQKRTKTVLILIIAAVVISLGPLFLLKGAQFTGSDDAGSNMIEQVEGGHYTPWFTPVLEQLIGGKLPGEMESFFFCIQTGIGVGIIAFAFGYLVARKKYGGENAGNDMQPNNKLSAKASEEPSAKDSEKSSAQGS